MLNTCSKMYRSRSMLFPSVTAEIWTRHEFPLWLEYRNVVWKRLSSERASCPCAAHVGQNREHNRFVFDLSFFSFFYRRTSNKKLVVTKSKSCDPACPSPQGLFKMNAPGEFSFSEVDMILDIMQCFITLIMQSSLIKKIWRKKARSCGLQSYRSQTTEMNWLLCLRSVTLQIISRTFLVVPPLDLNMTLAYANLDS